MNIRRPPVGRLLILQIAILLLVSAGCLLESPVSAYSALCGGLAFYIPNSIFALRFFQNRGARQASALFVVMMAGEMFKLTATAVLFSATLLLIRPINGPALFLGFGTMILSQVLTPFVFSRVAHR